jgi:tRNA(Ile)-lysidine synthase
MIDQLRQFVTEQRLFQPGDRVGVAVSGGADSVALLRAMLELQHELGLVLSVAHFHHQIRGAEADADQKFVSELADKFGLELHSGSGEAPAYAREHKISLETAARELRHRWFAQLVTQGQVDKIATAHTLDDQAETVLMRMVRGAGARGLAGISPRLPEKHLVRPLLQISRKEVEAYLRSLGQAWREDASNQDEAHTRNRVRHQLLPLLQKEFNPSIRQTLADLAEVARGEAEYWDVLLHGLMPRLVQEGKPSRSGRSSGTNDPETLALDLMAFQQQPLAVQRQVLQRTTERLGSTLEFKHVAELLAMIASKRRGRPLALPGGLQAVLTFRELQISRSKDDEAQFLNYEYPLQVPGEVAVPELAAVFRCRVIPGGVPADSRYNPSVLLERALLAPGLTVRNWQPGDRFYPAHSGSPKKVKELLQAGRLGRELTPAERKSWPVVACTGQIIWMKGFGVAEDFIHHAGDAVLIEEISNDSGAAKHTR